MISARPYLELSRLSNAPTCVSNVLVGCAVGSAITDWRTTTLIAIAVVLLYASGMALNDLVDRDVDRRQRPGRPIPSGRVAPRHAAAFVAITMLLGVAVVAFAAPHALWWTLGLVAAIVLYDLLHRRTPVAVVLMGACRGLVYIVAAVAVADQADWSLLTPLAAAITVYVILLTIVARAETERAIDARRWLALLIPLVVIAPLTVTPVIEPGRALVVGSLAGLWLVLTATHVLARPPRTQRAVLGWLAGICLMDWLYVTALGRPGLAAITVACFALTILGHRRILGT